MKWQLLFADALFAITTRASTTIWDEEWEDDGYFDPREHDPRIHFPRRRRLIPELNECASGLCCQRCRNDLEYCAGVLAGKLVEDTYYFAERQDDGVCYDIDKRVGNLDVFGPTKSFRDTSQCRELVRHYTCLWWASTNSAHTNNCDQQHDEVPVRPCRSFCTQIATQCANSLEYMDLCVHIECPPWDDTCQPGPELIGSSGEECNTWRYVSPVDTCTRPFPALIVVAVNTLLAISIAQMWL